MQNFIIIFMFNKKEELSGLIVGFLVDHHTLREDNNLLIHQSLISHLLRK